MKITHVTTYLYEVPPFSPAFRWRDGLPGSSPGGISACVRITTDEGIDGYTFSNRGRIVADLMERRIKEELLGRDPLQREWLWHRIWELDRIEEFPIYVLGMIDIALWDIAGKAAALPVYQLLGGFRKEIPAYASTVTYSSVEEYLDVADQCLEMGYPAIKLHAWGDARRDAELCLALRNHVGDEVDLMYDGSAGFDLPDAVYLGHALADAGYRWYEEPMREFNIGSYRRLAERVSVPLLVAETSDGCHFNTADFIELGTCEYVRTSSGLKGGITGAMRIAHLADAFQMRAEVHGGGAANRHLCMAIPNTTYYESLVYGNPVQDGGLVRSGMVAAPTEPGLGFDVTPEELAEKAIETV